MNETGRGEKMKYSEWMEKVKKKLEQKYKIRNMAESKFGLRIDFHNNFHYSIEHKQLEDLYYYSVSDAARSEDGFDHICDSIERTYMEQIAR